MKFVSSSTLSVIHKGVAHAGLLMRDLDIVVAMDDVRKSYSHNIGAPQIPNVAWEDVGGLASIKLEILKTIQLPLEHPELFIDGIKKRSGKFSLRLNIKEEISQCHCIQAYYCMDLPGQGKLCWRKP